MCDEFNAFLEKGTVIQILKLCEMLALTRLGTPGTFRGIFFC